MTTPTPAPGWYADPNGQAGLRYWDGTAWTNQTNASPASPGSTDSWARPAPAVSAYSSGDPFAGSGTSSTRGGMPPWAWAAIALVVVGVGVVVALGVGAATQGLSAADRGQDAAPVATGAPGPADPSDDDATGTETWITPQRLASFEVDRSWREDMDTVLDHTPTLRRDLAGSWNLDGLSFIRTRHFMYVWEYANVPDEGLSVEEAGEEYYSNLHFFDDIEVLSRATETFTTSNGYEVWVEILQFIDADGVTLDTYIAVTTDGNDWLVFDITSTTAGDRQDEIDFMIDTLVFLED
ncbi:MAG: hypothetical protein CVT64_03660 [Actinobacteria bacterium HGW-Actinobacteria-4]|nr:MAG: hypothetical protein CVT64_03660 [Actinobacteria bacterium HGW-Actinobacteria-4]